MIFETLAAMADRANDNKDNFNSTFQQTKAVLQDVDNDGLNGKGPKQLINFGTKSGNCPMHGKEGEYKHYLVGMQQKQPQSVIQRNVDSSSSSSSSSSNGAYVPTLQCAGGTEPSLILTVTGASGTVNWCNKVWNLPADSGLSQEVCPTYYEASQTIDTVASDKFALNLWRFASGDNFQLVRRYTSTPSSLFQTNFVRLINSLTNIRDYRAIWYNGNPLSFVFSYNSFNIGLISAVPDPTINDYRLTDAFFGSHTVGGVTFTWARGTNWS